MGRAQNRAETKLRRTDSAGIVKLFTSRERRNANTLYAV
jgi:hypothetical protein